MTRQPNHVGCSNGLLSPEESQRGNPSLAATPDDRPLGTAKRVTTPRIGSLSSKRARAYSPVLLCAALSVCLGCETTPNLQTGTHSAGLSVGDAGSVEDAGEPPSRSHPAVTRTVDEEDAVNDLSLLLDTLEGRSGIENAWRGASEDEIHRGLALGEAALPRALRHDLGESLPSDASSAQRTAIEAIDSTWPGALEVQWDDAMHSPGRLEQIGFVRRGVDAVHLWSEFERLHRDQLMALFDLSARDVLVLVEDSRREPFQVLTFQRTIDGIPVDGEYLSAYITSAASRLGGGVLWRVTARLSAGDAHILSDTDSAAILSEAVVAARLGLTDTPHVVGLHYVCAPTCRAVYLLANGRNVDAVDARTGERISSSDAWLHESGVVDIGSWTPGSGAFVPVRFRGAEILDLYGNTIGTTSQADGSYAVSGAAPWKIAPMGFRSISGTWQNGRVDRREAGDWTTIRTPGFITDWYPSMVPDPKFGAPDRWPSDSEDLPHGQEIIYGWLTYWQHLLRDHVYTQIPDTVSFTLNGGTPGTGTDGASADSIGMNTPAPGSGQATWGHIDIGWLDGDDVRSDYMWDMSLMAHEYSHLIATCAATQGTTCTNTNPGTQPHGQIGLGAWHRSVWDASIENLAEAQSAILTEFRSIYNGGNGPYNPSFTYAGYLSTTDSFGTATEDSAGGSDCTVVGCPGTHSCIFPTDESPVASSAGICARTCTFGGPACPSGLFCTTIYGLNVCWPNHYLNDWFSNVVGRLSVDVGWRNALSSVNGALLGDSNNYSRDFAVGSDTWYQHMADASLWNRLEVTRAVRTVNTEPGTPILDDFTDWPENALPVTVIDEYGTRIWWGNGAAEYPNFEDFLDSDAVLFRGVSAQRYLIEAGPAAGGPVDLGVSVYHLTAGGYTLLKTGSAPSGPSVSLTTDPLPAAGWYVVLFFNRALTSGAWSGRIRVAAGNDDFANTPEEAYPMPHGVSRAGVLSAYDNDRFQIYVPTTGTSVTFSATGSPQPLISAYRPDGTYAGGAYGSYSVPSTTQIGHWQWRVQNTSGTSRSYTTSASLGCASSGSGSCDDLTGDPAINARWSWGDRFAGRLPTATSSAKYTITLNQYENVSVAVADNTQTECHLTVDLLGPASMQYWTNGGNPVRIFRWNDSIGDGGGAANDPRSSYERLGAGGHFVAPVLGTYQVVVSASDWSSSQCHYRLFISRPSVFAEPMPAW